MKKGVEVSPIAYDRGDNLGHFPTVFIMAFLIYFQPFAWADYWSIHKSCIQQTFPLENTPTRPR